MIKIWWLTHFFLSLEHLRWTLIILTTRGSPISRTWLVTKQWLVLVMFFTSQCTGEERARTGEFLGVYFLILWKALSVSLPSWGRIALRWWTGRLAHPDVSTLNMGEMTTLSLAPGCVWEAEHKDTVFIISLSWALPSSASLPLKSIGGKQEAVYFLAGGII